jgi:hypothetical protein
VHVTQQIGPVLRRLPTAFDRSWRTAATWVEAHRLRSRSSVNLDDEIMHIAHDAGLTPVAAASLQRAVAESVQREAARLTLHDPDATTPRVLAIVAATALFVGVVYGLLWQRSWIAARGAVNPSTVATAPAPQREAPVASLTPATAVLAKSTTAKTPSADVASPPVPTVRPGLIRIVTEPPGARVTVNGVGRGVTPLTIRHLPPGAKRVRVTKDGYAGVERVISLAEDGPGQTVRIPLERRD